MEFTGAANELGRFLGTFTGGSWPGGVVKPTFGSVALGYVLLALGCAIASCLDWSKRRGMRGGCRLFWVAMLAPVIAAAHTALAWTIVCVALFGSD